MTTTPQIDRTSAPARPATTVWAQNEWEPLEEVVVGRLDGAAAESPAIPADETRRDLDTLAELLAAEGVRVHRPEPVPHERTFATADWNERGFSSACPRDGVLVVGDEILEAPLAWRARYYETDGLKSLFLSCFREGARWTSAPRPLLRDALYERPSGEWLDGVTPPLAVTELEPVFAASDVVRCDRDLFAMRSAGTNGSGIEWLRRHLAPDYRVHEIAPRKPVAGSLDTILLPLSPRDLLIRGDAIDPDDLPEALRGHTLRVAPPAEGPAASLALNVLLLDPERVLVERTQTAMIEALRGWGFEPIPVALAGYGALGGSVRRATLDIRRGSPPTAPR